jgi:hypothetical protein
MLASPRLFWYNSTKKSTKGQQMVKVYLVYRKGQLVDVFTSLKKAEAYAEAQITFYGMSTALEFGIVGKELK